MVVFVVVCIVFIVFILIVIWLVKFDLECKLIDLVICFEIGFVGLVVLYDVVFDCL